MSAEIFRRQRTSEGAGALALLQGLEELSEEQRCRAMLVRLVG
jgi:hypothetical protein